MDTPWKIKYGEISSEKCTKTLNEKRKKKKKKEDHFEDVDVDGKIILKLT
jgi:hypothetical protein